MVKKKKEEEKEETPQKKKIKKEKKIEKFPIFVLLEKFEIKPLNAIGFLNYYGLGEDFKKEFESGEIINEFSEEEFSNMYERYINRRI